MNIERFDIMPIGMNNGLSIAKGTHDSVVIMVWDTPERALSTQVKRVDIPRVIEALKEFSR